MPLRNLPELGDRLLYIRRMHDLSQAEMAAMVGATQQAIQQAETGKSQSPRYLSKLALLLDIPHEWLTMNIIPGRNAGKRGMSERGKDVLDSFYAMPKKDQQLMLELMRSRKQK